MSLCKIEKVNKIELSKIITNLDDVLKSNNIVIKKDKPIETILRKYYKKIDSKGNVKVSYKQSNEGRYFAEGSLSLQSIKRQIRQTICHEYYDDIDMVNAHPVILLHLCKKYNIETPVLKEYVDNRSSCLKRTGLKRDEAKKLYLMIMNTDDYQKASFKYPSTYQYEHVNAFQKEMKIIHESFYENNKEKADEHIRLRKLKGEKKYNMKASFVNIQMCHLENKILMCIMKYYKNPNDCVLCFDGIMLRKDYGHMNKRDITPTLCSRYIKRKIGIDMELKLKPMTEILDLSKYEIPTVKDMIDLRVYSECKPVPENTKKPDKKFNRQYVSKSLKNSYFNKFENNNIVLKSDTGTGKTSSFASYIKKTNKNFISIGSRISLCDAHYETFIETGLDCCHYKNHEGKFKQGDNIVIMLDSIHKIRDIDLSNYVIYLDEFAFLTEYLITSSTLNEKRIIAFRLMMKCITSCKQFICTDADIGPICISLLDLLNVKYQFHKNSFQNAKGVKCVELETGTIMIEKMKKLNKYLVCCDSKTVADGLYKEMEDSDIGLFTSDHKGTINLEDYKKAIYSPKIINGLDSKMKRDVLAYYKEQTISPEHMVQQVNRCRNIKTLYYIFPDKRINQAKYDSIDDVKETINRQDSLFMFDMLATPKETYIFKELYASILYKLDCYETNKFMHFKNILKSRGLEDSDSHFDNSKETMITRREIINEKIDNFDTEILKDKIEEDGTLCVGKTNLVNDILCIPDDKLEEYKEFLVDQYKLQDHFNMCQFFFKKDELKKLNKTNDFKAKKSITSKGKFQVIRDICDDYGIDINTEGIIKATKNVSDTVINQCEMKYKTAFRYQGKGLEFKKKSNVVYVIVKAIRNLCGSKIIKSKRKGVGDNRITKYILNKKEFAINKTLWDFRTTKDNTNNDKTIKVNMFKNK